MKVACRQKGFSIRNDSGFRYWLKQRLKVSNKPLEAPLSFTEAAKVSYHNNSIGEITSDLHRSEQRGLLTANSELSAIATEKSFTGEYKFNRSHPYLNSELISLALSCPAYLLSTYEQTKWISRQALAGLLPATVLRSPRIGQLDILFEQGLEKNSDEIRQYLWRPERRWHEYIREECVLDVLENKRWEQAASIIVPCLGFERWLDEWRALDLPVL